MTPIAWYSVDLAATHIAMQCWGGRIRLRTWVRTHTSIHCVVTAHASLAFSGALNQVIHRNLQVPCGTVRLARLTCAALST